MDNRNLAILEGVARLGEDATARHIAEIVNLPQATAYRRITDLEELGMVERVGRVYQIGPRLYNLLALGTSSRELANTLSPTLSSMAEAVGETTFAARLVEGGIELFDTRVPADPKGAIVVPNKGLRPASICSSAKAILAHLPRSLQTEIILTAALLFPNLPAKDVNFLQAEFEKIRNTGIAYCIGEEDPDIASVAISTKLNGAFGQICIGIVGPRGRIVRKLEHNIEKTLKMRAASMALT